jgi:hypothetical protein
MCGFTNFILFIYLFNDAVSGADTPDGLVALSG